MSSEANAVALRARQLSIGYAERRRPEAVVASGLELELRRGEFVCLLGPNGAGKSTLMRSLAGMQPALSGRIEISGTGLDELSLKERARAVSVVLTDGQPMGLFSVWRLVAMGRHPHTRWTGGLRAVDEERIEWALRAVGAWDLAERQVAELSDGERQKALIARALAQDAPLVLLDEPTAFLDLPRRVDLMWLLRDLAREAGLSVLLSTHDLDLALRSADRLWLLGKGGGFAQGLPEALAMEGAIARIFDCAEVDWDEEQGGFRMHRSYCATIGLVGDGPVAAWTRRALARIGYRVASGAAGGEALQVEARGQPGRAEWICRSGAETRRLDSLEAVVAWALRPARR